mmetsp:Transcript_44142/g.99746  ORF Transcript_44142/g.99746 Transcript_44142/m.99746 type:complete len:113 (-) Transcript_44142:66-404(-)
MNNGEGKPKRKGDGDGGGSGGGGGPKPGKKPWKKLAADDVKHCVPYQTHSCEVSCPKDKKHEKTPCRRNHEAGQPLAFMATHASSTTTRPPSETARGPQAKRDLRFSCPRGA